MSRAEGEQVHLSELYGRELLLFELGFQHGYALGQESRQAEVDALNHTADRYYAEMCRRPAPTEPETPPYADLCRIRGEHARAARQEARLRKMWSSR